MVMTRASIGGNAINFLDVILLDIFVIFSIFHMNFEHKFRLYGKDKEMKKKVKYWGKKIGVYLNFGNIFR